MAPNPVIANAGHLTLNWSGPQRTWQNVLGVTGTTALPNFDQALADTLFNTLRADPSMTAYMSFMASTTILESLSIRSLNTANQPLFTSTGTPLGGAATGDPLPLSVASCVTLRTALAGKRFRGRMYLSGWSETSNDTAGRMTQGASTASVQLVSALTNTLAVNGMNLAVVGRARDPVTIPAVTRPALPGIVNRATAGIVRNLKWESQRQRTGRV